MESPGTQEPRNETRPTNHFVSKVKLFLISVLILLLAISFTFVANSNYFRIQHLRSTLSSSNPIAFFRKLLPFLNTPPKKTQLPNPDSRRSSQCVLWMAPFLSGGGYSSEAWSYILSLHEYSFNEFRLSIRQHGDLESLEFWEGLPEEYRNLAIELYQTRCTPNETIVVCHSEPGAWYPPLFDTPPCPPGGYGKFKAVIGRTMFETDKVSQEHVKRCNEMDFVWVPTDFHVSTFTQSGVEPSKIVKVVQSVDVEFFDPSKYEEPLDVTRLGVIVLGSSSNSNKFAFLSVFKWEFRKGWDVLLTAYLKEFTEVDGVALYLLTNPYHSDRDFGNKIVEFVESSDLQKPIQGWAPIYVIDAHIAQVDFPRLFKAADAFVLPSRGEGWGRPVVEAMAMAMPVIATNWSGQTEYLTEKNGYPLEVERMSEVTEGPFKGHFWAEPSASKLQILMRHVMSDAEEAKARGRQAREDMITYYSPKIVARIVTDQIQNALKLNKRSNSTG